MTGSIVAQIDVCPPHYRILREAGLIVSVALRLDVVGSLHDQSQLIVATLDELLRRA